MNRTQLLQSIPLFQAFEQSDLDELAAELREVRLAQGEVLFEAGDPGESMYIVAQGAINIHLPGAPAAQLSLADLSTGKYFGEVVLFDDKPRTAGARALEPTVLLELHRDVFRSYIERHPQGALGVLHTMAGRLRQSTAMLSERTARNAVAEYEKELHWPDRLADMVATLNGSWAFILLLSGLMLGWTGLNAHWVLSSPLDPYPYKFFNLLLAVLVALQWPLIVMSQNRRAAKDRRTAEVDFAVNLKNEVNCEALLQELRALRLARAKNNKLRQAARGQSLLQR